MCTFNVKNGASLMVAFYISISFSILVSLSKDLLQCSFSNLERSEFEKIISRNKMKDSVETYLQEFSFCSNFRRTKMKNKYFRRHENREKEKCRWFVCNLTPSSIRFFFFLFLFFKYYNNWWLLMKYFSSFALSRGREPKSIPPFCSFTRLSCSNIMFINFFLFLCKFIHIYFLFWWID